MFALSNLNAPSETESAQARSRCGAWAGGIIAALFIALASALLPGSMPSSQLVGSAFNPATTQVALNRTGAEQEQLFVVPDNETRHLPFDGGSGKPAGLASPFATLQNAYSRASTPAFAPVDARLVPADTRPGSGPRAPPAAHPSKA
jgi:hypothetical protein